MTTERWVTAFHEAAHVVVAGAVGLKVTRVTIEPTYDTFYRQWRVGTTEIEVLGDHATDYSPAMRARLRREAIFSLAGPAAERRVVGHATLDGDDIDAQVAEWLLSRDACDLPRVLRRAQAIADRLVTERWSAIERLAAALISHRTLTRAQLRRSTEEQEYLRTDLDG